MRGIAFRLSGCLFGVVVMGFASAVASAGNIAGQGTGIIGVNSSIGTSLGTPTVHAGTVSAINDGDLTTHVDTFGTTMPDGYVGVLFSSPRTDLIQSVTLNNAVFFDGGWFGPNSSGPGAQGTLNSTYLIAPTLQATVDGGVTWTNVPTSDDYVARMTGTVLPVAFGPPTLPSTATFTLTTPLTGVDGIRLIGSVGGTAGGPGFLGVFELGVNSVPEPALTGLLGALAVGLLARRRR